MKITRNVVFSGLIAFALLTGCNNKNKELEGTVFIVTKSRENIKMGLVTVSLFDADHAKQSLRKVRDELRNRTDEIAAQSKPLLVTVTNLRRDYETNKAVYEAALDAETKSKDILIKQFNAIPGRSELYDFDLDAPSYLSALDDAHTIQLKEAVYAELYPKLVSARKALNAAGQTAELRRTQLNKAIDAYNLATQPQRDLISNYQTLSFAALGTSISSVKTDADGKFKLMVPRSDEFVLAASASREVGSESESYLWIVVDSLGRKDRGQIFLSNDNLADGYSATSLVERLGIQPIEHLSHELKSFIQN